MNVFWREPLSSLGDVTFKTIILIPGEKNLILCKSS